MKLQFISVFNSKNIKKQFRTTTLRFFCKSGLRSAKLLTCFVSVEIWKVFTVKSVPKGWQHRIRVKTLIVWEILDIKCQIYQWPAIWWSKTGNEQLKVDTIGQRRMTPTSTSWCDFTTLVKKQANGRFTGRITVESLPVPMSAD